MLLLTFTAGANRYAVDVARVVEVIPRVALRAVPHAPVYLAGLLGYRGEVVPVIDLGVLLDALPCPNRLNTRIILVNMMVGVSERQGSDRNDASEYNTRLPSDLPPRRDLLGLIGERVSDLINIRSDQVQPATMQVPEAPYLGAIVQVEEGIVQLIVVEKIWDITIQGAALGPDIVNGLANHQ